MKIDDEVYDFLVSLTFRPYCGTVGFCRPIYEGREVRCSYQNCCSTLWAIMKKRDELLARLRGGIKCPKCGGNIFGIDVNLNLVVIGNVAYIRSINDYIAGACEKCGYNVNPGEILGGIKIIKNDHDELRKIGLEELGVVLA